MREFTSELEMRVSQTPSANNSFHLYLADKSGRKVAACWGGSEEKMANGYLWSAAPDLYAALERVTGAYGFDPSIDSSVWQEVFAALAKARGEQ
jgi:hypothetical protein